MKRLILFAAACMTGSAFATIYYFTGAETASWQDVNSYRIGSRTGDVPGSLPGAGDDVWIGAALSSQTNRVALGDADCAFASRLHSVNVNNGELTIDVAKETHLACPINGATETGSFRREGKIIKKGAGELYLDAYCVFVASKHPADYLTKEFAVEEGVVYLQKDHDKLGKTSGYLGSLSVNEGCTFYLPNADTTSYNTGGIEGLGQILLVPGFAPTVEFSIHVNGYAKRPFDFGGRLTGNVRVVLAGNVVEQLLSNPENNSGYDMQMDGNNNTFAFSVGAGGKNDVQQLGTNSSFYITNREKVGDSTRNKARGDNNRLLYRGDGESKGKYANDYEKVTYFYPGTSIIDGGDIGGLDLFRNQAGYLWFNGVSVAYEKPGVGRLVFQGEGEKTNTVFGAVFDYDEHDNGQGYHGYPLSIVKRGKGTWFLKHHKTRQYNSVVAADEGTLQFETIVPIGPTAVCSLGRGTKTYDPDYSFTGDDVDEAKKVGYQLRVGGGKTSGTLEYVGTAAVVNSDRILAVNGNGTFKNSSAEEFVQDGIVTTDKVPEHTLTLAGTGNGIARNITNVVGRLNVVKEGAGGWELDQKLDINGTLEVKQGTLTVCNPNKYTWFRFTVKENMSEVMVKKGFEAYARMKEFALYDADGIRQNVGLERRVGTDTQNLAEGQVGLQAGVEVAGDETKKYQIDQAFNEKSENQKYEMNAWGPLGNGATKGLIPEREDSWFRLVMRLPDNVNEITAFDYVCISTGPDTKGGDATKLTDTWYVSEPRIYAIEGSADGIHWSEPLHEETDFWQNHIAKAGCWASSDGTEDFKAGKVRKNAGFKINTAPSTTAALTDVAEVSVAKGATLELIGNIAPLKGLKIDAQNGMGTITGKPTLNATGVLNLTNIPDAKNFNVVVDWSQFANPEALDGWTLSVNGVPSRKFVFTRTANGVRVDAPGMVILLY